jgi:hypothetical protein
LLREERVSKSARLLRLYDSVVVNLANLIRFWDDTILRFLTGASTDHPRLTLWQSAYSGRGRGAVVYEAFPEPYLGAIGTVPPAAVILALNPGQAHLDFQARDGIFADEIRTLGSYSAWAASWPYLRDPWVKLKSPNRHYRSRLQFIRRWYDDETIPAERYATFELLPWHSFGVTGAIRPDPSIVDEFIWQPIADMGDVPVFAFGAPWFPILEGSPDIEIVDRLGAGGCWYPTRVASRSVLVGQSRHGSLVVAEKHSGSAVPPSVEEIRLLRTEIEALQ